MVIWLVGCGLVPGKVLHHSDLTQVPSQAITVEGPLEGELWLWYSLTLGHGVGSIERGPSISTTASWEIVGTVDQTIAGRTETMQVHWDGDGAATDASAPTWTFNQGEELIGFDRIAHGQVWLGSVDLPAGASATIEPHLQVNTAAKVDHLELRLTD
ncbi:MAG: hypothetical protein ABMA64_11390 [Myxococcota bacterium]